MATLAKLLDDLLGALSGTLDSAFSNAERKSYVYLVECLAKADSIAVKDAAEHLAKEGHGVAIPPLFLAAQKHPLPSARDAAARAMGKLDRENEIGNLVSGKSLEEAMSALIERYGNYRLDSLS